MLTCIANLFTSRGIFLGRPLAFVSVPWLDNDQVIYHEVRYFWFHLQIESELAVVRQNVTAVRKELQSHTAEVMGLLGRSFLSRQLRSHTY